MDIIQKVKHFFVGESTPTEETEPAELDEPKIGFKKFRISKPYGYFIEEVDEYVQEVISVVAGKDRKIREKDVEIGELKSKILSLQYELSTIEAPAMSQEYSDKLIEAAKEKLNIRPKNDHGDDDVIVID